MNHETSVYLGLGSNLGDREKNLDLALEKISADPVGRLIRVSSFYRSEPWGMKDQPWFLNAVCQIETRLSPEQLLETLKTMERNLGRAPSDEHWGPRVIDLDIILFRDLILDTPLLTIPHQYCTERLFVLMPLVEIAPEMIHPATGIPFKKHRDQLLKTEPEGACLKWNRTA